jgi:hypothetical protein
MGANNTGDDITIGEYNKASSGTVLSIQPFSGVKNFSDAGLVVDSTAFFTSNAIRAQAVDGAAVLAINSSFGSAAVSATNSVGGDGVFGNCDDGSGVRGLTQTSFGVRGTSLPKVIDRASSGVLGTSNQQGTGVIGFSEITPNANPDAPITDNPPISFPGYGVAGFGFNGGVHGVSSAGYGVRGDSSGFIGLYATSESNRAGVFMSGKNPDNFGSGPPITSQEGIAQVRLVPSSSPKLPSKGQIGDLFVHQVPKNQPPNAPVNLYLCVQSNPLTWRQVQLAPTDYPGGTTAP